MYDNFRLENNVASSEDTKIFETDFKNLEDIENSAIDNLNISSNDVNNDFYNFDISAEELTRHQESKRDVDIFENENINSSEIYGKIIVNNNDINNITTNNFKTELVNNNDLNNSNKKIDSNKQIIDVSEQYNVPNEDLRKDAQFSNFHIIDSETDLDVPSGIEGPIPAVMLPPDNINIEKGKQLFNLQNKATVIFSTMFFSEKKSRI